MTGEGICPRYRQTAERTGDMNTKRIKIFTLILMLLAFVSLALASCERPGSSPNSVAGSTPSSGSSATSGPSGGETTVHMGPTTFKQSTISIKKGDNLTLIDDVAVIHIIQNGVWDSSGNAKPGKENGAPTVNVNFNGNDQHMIGPFNAAGTFHLYCTIHPGMNLTVTVQ